MLTTWKVRIELLDPPTDENEELLMALSQAYLEWEQATEQRSKLDVICDLLKTRFGELDAELTPIAPQILALPPAEYAALLLQLTQLDRADLLNRFSNGSKTNGSKTSAPTFFAYPAENVLHLCQSSRSSLPCLPPPSPCPPPPSQKPNT
jgi:hypothetical protein